MISYEWLYSKFKSMATASDKVTVSVIVTKEVHDKLKRLANSKRWSVSQTGAVLIKRGLRPGRIRKTLHPINIRGQHERRETRPHRAHP